MAWREPMQAEDEKPDPIKELLKPKTLDQCWQEYTDEMIDATYFSTSAYCPKATKFARGID
jgi:hypothetical protein